MIDIDDFFYCHKLLLCMSSSFIFYERQYGMHADRNDYNQPRVSSNCQDTCYKLDKNRKGKALSDTQSKMALLVMDMQVGIVNRFAQNSDVLTHVNTAITALVPHRFPLSMWLLAFVLAILR